MTLSWLEGSLAVSQIVQSYASVCGVCLSGRVDITFSTFAYTVYHIQGGYDYDRTVHCA